MLFFFCVVRREEKKGYSTAELYIPKEFTSNDYRPLNRGEAIQMQYLTHATHSPQKDLIWNGRVANLVGCPKMATLHMSPNEPGWVRVATWQAVRGGLRQLQLTKCKSCLRTNHQCAGHCCRVSSNEYLNVGDKMAEFSLRTCKKGISLEEVEKTCHWKRCYEVERVLPGSYVWFGVAKLKGEHKHDEVDEKTFLNEWEKDNIFGTYSFVVNIHTLLASYGTQIAKGREVILRCGGTFLYSKEVCYIVIVTCKDDKQHDKFPAVTTVDDGGRCNWRSLLDDTGHFTKHGYPSFTPHHVIKGTKHLYWDHVVFAVSLPPGTALELNREALCGKKPQITKHSGLCQRFKINPRGAATSCEESEKSYRKSKEIEYKMSKLGIKANKVSHAK